MTEILNLLYHCLVLALVVLGLAVVFGMLGVMNMAHGEFLMLGAYSAVTAQLWGLSPLWGVVLAIVVCAIFGWILERALIRHLYRRPFDTLLATWGVSILLRELVELVYGRGYQNVDQAFTGSVSVFGTPYPAYRIVLMGVVLACFALLAAWYGRSSSGARVRAMVGNPVLAQAVGIPTATLANRAFVFGVVTAGVAGALLAPLVRVEPAMGLDYLLNSFFVLVVGGLGSLAGLITGTAMIGGTQVVVSNLFDQTSGYLAVLAVSLVFLWLKPNGLIARR